MGIFMGLSQAKLPCHAAAIFSRVLPCIGLFSFGMKHPWTALRPGLCGGNRLAKGLLQIPETMFVLRAQLLRIGVWKVLHPFAAVPYPALGLRRAGS